MSVLNELILRSPQGEDENTFLAAMKSSQSLHQPWIKAPLTAEAFKHYLERSRRSTQESFLACDAQNNIVGVYNLNEIVRGQFQSAYLGYYVVAEFVGKGYMSAGLKLVLEKAFAELGLHRLEANIQPENTASIQLVEQNGFRKEGFSPRYLNINGEWRDHERWAITVEDWKK